MPGSRSRVCPASLDTPSRCDSHRIIAAFLHTRAGLRYLAAADPTQLTAVTTAARANVLGGFTAGKGYCDDAAYSPRAWLIHQTRITKGAATAHTAWVRRARAHPRIMAALAAEEMSEPYARTLC